MGNLCSALRSGAGTAEESWAGYDGLFSMSIISCALATIAIVWLIFNPTSGIGLGILALFCLAFMGFSIPLAIFNTNSDCVKSDTNQHLNKILIGYILLFIILIGLLSGAILINGVVNKVSKGGMGREHLSAYA